MVVENLGCGKTGNYYFMALNIIKTHVYLFCKINAHIQHTDKTLKQVDMILTSTHSLLKLK